MTGVGVHLKITKMTDCQHKTRLGAVFALTPVQTFNALDGKNVAQLFRRNVGGLDG